MSYANELDPIELGDAIADAINALPTGIDDLEAKAVRAYHYTDGNSVPDGEASWTVYPMRETKERFNDHLKDVTIQCFAVLKTPMRPDDTDAGDQLLRYARRVDRHFEGRPMCDARHVINDDEVLYWMPDELHNSNHFLSVIELNYTARVAIGDDA